MTTFESEARWAHEDTAAQYVELVGPKISTAVESPRDIGLLERFARVVRAPVLDVGCGHGRVSSFLRDRGIGVFGIDIAHAMVSHAVELGAPTVAAQASQTALPARDHVFGGVVSWYSIMYVEPDALARLWLEFARVLAPGAPLLVGFRAGHGQEFRRDDFYGSGRPLSLWFHDPATIAAAQTRAGLRVRQMIVRPSRHRFGDDPQAFIVAVAR